MGSIDRYIFRTTLASFAVVLVSLTGVIWITQALRGIDLMTSQGQTIVTFLGITGLIIPSLVLIIAPIALMISISHTLNKLATDSEIIVMNAAGFSPFQARRLAFALGLTKEQVGKAVGFMTALARAFAAHRARHDDAEQALSLVHAITGSEDGPFLIDAVSTQDRFLAGLTDSGWIVERPFQRMRFGRATVRTMELPFAVVGPEFG